MSAKGVILSFADGTNLALTEEQLSAGAVVRFGPGFEHLRVTCDESVLKLISQDEVPNEVPTVELAMKTAVLGGVQSLTEAVPRVSEPAYDLDLPTTFNVGMTEMKKASLTKTQIRNMNRKYKKSKDRLEQEAGAQRVATVSEVVDYTPVEAVPAVEEYVPQYIRGMPPRQTVTDEDLGGLQNVTRQNFKYFQMIRGRYVNILEGLELHSGIFSEVEQRRILHAVYDFRDQGRAGLLFPRTYSEPRKWMRGKGRVTIQFGCCYNYAVDAKGNPPGIMRHEDVDPIPPFLKDMIRRMVTWQVLPPESTPDSAIINIYEEGDCIPPHVDSHDFLRPFCTASFLGECSIVLGTELKIRGPGEFSGPVDIPLPVGSVLVLAGNGADLAKHCVPAVPRPRVSITFRKMDPRKLPHNFKLDPELQQLQSLSF